MPKSKAQERLLAIILIFTLTFANFAFVTKAYAAGLEDLFGERTDTGSRNVKFEAFFETEDERVTSVISDVNNQNLVVKMNINIEKTGYLKEGQIEIRESKENEGLNFISKELEELPEFVQSINENVILLKQIENSEDTFEIEFPIEYQNEEFFDESNLSKDFEVIFSGIYVDGKGREREISKTNVLNLTWTEEREVKVSTNIEKYIDFGEGVILQTKVIVDSSKDSNTLPVKQNELTIKVPKYLDILPSNVYVIANSTAGTNGNETENVDWSYDEETNLLKIHVENIEQLVEVNSNEDEFLQDIEKDKIYKLRYYNTPGIDEYLITYTYNNVDIQENVIAEAEIENKLSLLNGIDKEIINNDIYEYTLDEKTGDIVSLNKENETDEVSKIYFYANKNEEKYEVELKSKSIVNVSYKDIVENIELEDTENTYVDKNGKILENEDVVYKDISISVENFNQMLGEEGEIKVLDENENIVTTINSELGDFDGNYIFNFEEPYSKLKFEVSKPVSEGNLIINNTKAITNISLDKEEIEQLTEITEDSKIRAKYNYVEESIDVQNLVSKIDLEDTETRATISVEPKSLATLETNENVEIKVELNNASEKSDLYGHSEFEIEFPEYIKNVEIVNASILYGEGLEITSVEGNENRVKVVIDGIQDGINQSGFTNGTDIILNANITLDKFTPLDSGLVRLKTLNEEATNYNNEGLAECLVTYSAPTGVVSVNSIENFNNEGDFITSVNEGTQEAIIPIYSASKIAKMELTIMNNNLNDITKLYILGRIPFEGVKDILNGDNLGTTLNTKMITGIVPDENNGIEYKFYYSENGEATKDLEDENNGWTEYPENLENVRSYLIVPIDEEIIIEPTKILRFSYEFEIPENLAHNEYFCGTFTTYYRDLSEISPSNEKSVPDIVRLTTGVGPELNLEVTSNKDEIKEGESFEVVVKATNTGDCKAEEVVVNVAKPLQATLVSYEIINGNPSWKEYEKEYFSAKRVDDEKGSAEFSEYIKKITESNNSKVWPFTVSKDVLEPGEAIEFKMIFKALLLGNEMEQEVVTEIPENISEEEIFDYMGIGENQYIHYINKGKAETLLEIQAEATSKDLGATIETKSSEIKVREAELTLRESISSCGDILAKGTDATITYTLNNEKDYALKNVKVLENLPKELSFVDANLIIDNEEIKGKFDENTRNISWNIDEIAPNATITFKVIVGVGELEEGVSKATVSTKLEVTLDENKYEAMPLEIVLGRPILTIYQEKFTDSEHIKSGEKVDYIFTVANEGSVPSKEIKLVDRIPDEIIPIGAKYEINGKSYNQSISSDTDVVINIDLDPNETAIVTLEGKSKKFDGNSSVSAENIANISTEYIQEIESNSVVYIIDPVENTKNSNSTKNSSSNPSTNITSTAKKYSVSGIAWFDENRDGMKASKETKLSGLTVRLINSQNGNILKTTSTDTNGKYTFSEVESGTYLVLIDYDTEKYKLTTYQKSGVSANSNSDFITTNIEQDGKRREGAVTDIITVSSSSITGIDLGLVLAETFDLKLDKSISKVTVQTVKGTETINYNNSKFVKAEIATKELVGATVFVEYTITVSNVGDIAGSAKKIVDYMPKGMTFNSTLQANTNWYTGTDGNLYTEELGRKELKKGESATIKLVLTRQMTPENTDIVSNIAEIYEDYNKNGFEDVNSKTRNKAQGENDLSTADIAIFVKTGEEFIYTSVIMTTVMLGIIVIFVTYTRIISRRNKK